jgi:outer membrane receptor protein involved in Fe transport
VRIPFIRSQRANVFVDEMPVSYDYLNMLPAADIAMIKVIKGPFSAGWSSGGAIAVYTIRGEEEEE